MLSIVAASAGSRVRGFPDLDGASLSRTEAKKPAMSLENTNQSSQTVSAQSGRPIGVAEISGKS
jgi:hypothetical protein